MIKAFMCIDAISMAASIGLIIIGSVGLGTCLLGLNAALFIYKYRRMR